MPEPDFLKPYIENPNLAVQAVSSKATAIVLTITALEHTANSQETEAEIEYTTSAEDLLELFALRTLYDETADSLLTQASDHFPHI